MKPSTKILTYFFAAIIFVSLKFWFSDVNHEDVLFLLKPINKLVNIATGSNSFFQAETGYINENLNIIINKTCSGFNFLMIVFLMLTFLMVKYFRKIQFQIFIIPVALVFSYVFTILVNVSRILLSVLLNDNFKNTSIYLHQFEGTFMYLSCLMLLYLTADYLLKTRTNEEFA